MVQDVGGAGWMDRGRRGCWVGLARFITRNCRAEEALMGLRCICELREMAEMVAHVANEVCEGLPQTDSTAQIVIGASVMQAMRRSMKECLDGRRPLCVFR
jgi:hypothetical protein